MKVPAIRAQIGVWVYYISNLTFEQVAQYVKRVDDELHKSTVLREMLQRSITDNYKKIATYIEQQDERFFNSLVLAVYDGDPQWHEVRLDYGDGEEYYDIGLLELSGEEKIFPVDGQHRVEGIKEVIGKGDAFNAESIPVIFIGHRNNDVGMQRARRLFSTLNRYAKPVSKRDIIALDEDDCVAIISRNLIKSYSLFENEHILDAKGKAIPESNNKAFTSIIAFYECNYELLGLFLTDIVVKNPDGKKVNGGTKSKEFIRFRPNDEQLKKFEELCKAFWDSIITEIDDIKTYVSREADATIFRNRNGGNLLFRPAALIPFVKAVLLIQQKTKKSFAEIAKGMNEIILNIDSPEWGGVLWDRENHKMLMNHHKAVELILVHYFDSSLLNDDERNNLINKYASVIQVSPKDASQKLETLGRH
jgi:DNA sulfur modification protein DndB